MKYLKIFTSILILILSSTEAKKPASFQEKYTLSIVCIFYNEADYLKEWIEYHRLVGVDHFYLYNNNSDDHYLEVLTPYMQKGIVDVMNWPSPPDKDWSPYQRDAYRHCVQQNRQTSAWMAFIDTDEFIVPLSHSSIPEFLNDYQEYGGVFISWQCYGTSHLPSILDGKLLIESLTYKYPWNHEKNRWYKTIAQPRKIKDCFIHECSFKNGYYAVSPSGVAKKPSVPDIEKIRINHYWTRAEDFFYNIKIPRIERYTHKKVDNAIIDKILRESNSKQDQTILPFVPELKKAMHFD